MTRRKEFKMFVYGMALFALVILPACQHCCHDSSSCCNAHCCGRGGYSHDAAAYTPVDSAVPAITPPAESHVHPGSPKVGDEIIIGTKPEAPKASETKPEVVKPVEPKKVETPKVVETKPEVVKPVEPKKVETPKVVDTKPSIKNVEASPARKAIRIKAGAAAPWKDKDGNEWLADAGFAEGAMVDLGKSKIDGTTNPELYMSEHNSMEKFSWPVPNGKYTIKLHFVENPDDVKKVGERVFSIDVLGEKIKSLDILKEAGGFNKALVKTVHVNVTAGKIEIGFKAEQKESQINGIEILPE